MSAQEFVKVVAPTPSSLINLNSTKASLHDNAGDTIRIGIGSRAAIFEVTVPLGANLPGNADGGTTVGDTPGELVDGASLVAACETLVVVLACES